MDPDTRVRVVNQTFKTCNEHRIGENATNIDKNLRWNNDKLRWNIDTTDQPSHDHRQNCAGTSTKCAGTSTKNFRTNTGVDVPEHFVDVPAQFCRCSMVMNVDVPALEIVVVPELLMSMFKCRCSCLLYTSPSPRDGLLSRMPSSA